MKEGFSVIICTRNRADLLAECLQSFVGQNPYVGETEIMIVDNGSTDHTKGIVNQFKNQISTLRYVHEDRIGLSVARNRGVAESAYDWVCFVDDDARVHANFLQRMWYVRNHYSFDGFGGMFYPWYIKPKPPWLSSEFGKKNKTLESIGPMKPGQTAAGGICAFNREKLLAAGSFPENIGMRGKTVGYGEEDALQHRMWQQGCVIGFDPEWKMDHLVAEYKYSPWWHLRRSFAKGRDYQTAIGSVPFTKKILLACNAFVLVPYLFLKNLKHFFSQKTYYPENYLLDSLRMPFRLLGRVIAR